MKNNKLVSKIYINSFFNQIPFTVFEENKLKLKIVCNAERKKRKKERERGEFTQQSA